MARATEPFEGSSDQRSQQKFRITPRTLPKLVRFGWALRKAVRTQDMEADRPEVVLFDDRSQAVLERARDLAVDEREDQAAASELAKMAKGDKRTLRLAALGARQWGRNKEATVENLAHRLLQAAIHDSRVEPISPEERDRLAEIDTFSEEEEPWQVLIEREPRLAELEADARAGLFGRRDILALPQEERRDAAAHNLKGMELLNERLEPLVGPNAETADVILSTEVAHEIAHGHLMDLGRRARQSPSDLA